MNSAVEITNRRFLYYTNKDSLKFRTKQIRDKKKKLKLFTLKFDFKNIKR